MKFNPTFLEILVFVIACLIIFIWTKHGRRIRRWLQGYFRQRRGPRQLTPKSLHDCPACNQLLSLLPLRPKPDVVPWSERKSPRGRPKTIDSNGFACLHPLCDYFASLMPGFKRWSATAVVASRRFAIGNVRLVAGGAAVRGTAIEIGNESLGMMI